MLFYATLSSWQLVDASHAIASKIMFDFTVNVMLSYYIVTSFIMVFMLSLMLSGFLMFHIWLILKQYTTIEFCEKRKKKNFSVQSPYDLGWFKNLRNVLGSNPLLWIVPLCK
jgi:hypothetical protein